MIAQYSKLFSGTEFYAPVEISKNDLTLLRNFYPSIRILIHSVNAIHY